MGLNSATLLVGALFQITTTEGVITFQIKSDAPAEVAAAFVDQVRDKVYEGTVVHHVDPKRSISGGAYKFQDGRLIETKAQAVQVDSIEPARSKSVGSFAIATRRRQRDYKLAEFMINLEIDGIDERNGFVAIAHVREGMDVVKRIAQGQTALREGLLGVPAVDIVVKSIERIPTKTEELIARDPDIAELALPCSWDLNVALPAIVALKRLRSLKLGCLPKDPDELGKLTNLAVLDLSSQDQRLREIPAFVRSLNGLKRLVLADNWLERIADPSVLPAGLEAIDLRENRLIDLPEAWAGMGALKSIDLGDNCVFATSSSERAALSARFARTKIDFTSHRTDCPRPSDELQKAITHVVAPPALAATERVESGSDPIFDPDRLGCTPGLRYKLGSFSILSTIARYEFSPHPGPFDAGFCGADGHARQIFSISDLKPFTEARWAILDVREGEANCPSWFSVMLALQLGVGNDAPRLYIQAPLRNWGADLDCVAPCESNGAPVAALRKQRDECIDKITASKRAAIETSLREFAGTLKLGVR